MDTPATPAQGHGARWLLLVIVLVIIGAAIYIFRENIFNLQGDVTSTFNSEPVVTTTTNGPTVRTVESKEAFRNDMTAIMAEAPNRTSSTERHETFTQLLGRMAEEF